MLKIYGSEDWMDHQIAHDLAFFEDKKFCEDCLKKYYLENNLRTRRDVFCLISIKNRQMSFHVAPQFAWVLECEHQVPEKLGYLYPRYEKEISKRLLCLKKSFTELARNISLPDTTFIISVHDEHRLQCDLPIFAMAKRKGKNDILFPDFDALGGRYQVMEGINLDHEDFDLPWNQRDDRLVWRGATNFNLDLLNSRQEMGPRFHLCQFSHSYPSLIDAGFTFIHHPKYMHLNRYEKAFLSTEQIFSYKYQAWIDGAVTSYTNSGWRFFTGSTVVKENSPYVQWYFQQMQPWVHYVPVQHDLSDLIDTLLYLRDHEDEAQQIARNGLMFARTHITQELNMKYMEKLIWAYSKLEHKCLCTHH